MKSLLLTASVFVLTRCFGYGQSGDTTSTRISNPFLSLRSVQANVATLLVINTIGAACDINMMSFSLHEELAAGLRIGFQHAAVSSIRSDGSSHSYGSPFTDLDLLLRFSSSDSLLISDVYFGCAYHYGTSKPFQPYPSSPKFKYGGEVKSILLEPFWGLILQFNSTIGGSTKPVTVLAIGIVFFLHT